MNCLKFIHTADLHLDSPFVGLQQLPGRLFKRIQESTFAAFTKIVDLAIEEQVDFIIISGDLYDSEDRGLKAQTRFRKEMSRLNEHRIEVYIIHGNHDHTGGRWVHLSYPSNVHFFSDKVVEVKSFEKNEKKRANLYGISYQQRVITENITPFYIKEGDAPFHIGILHGTLEGQTDHSRYAPFKRADLLQKEFDYWALGHIHKRQVLHESPAIVYPGNIQGRHRKETDTKGCYVVTLTENRTELSFRSTADIIWDEVQISITDLASVQQLLDVCYEKIDQMRQEQQGVLTTIELVGSSSLHKELQDQTKIEDIIHTLVDGEELKDNFVWVVALNVRTSHFIDREQLKEDSSFLRDLLATVDDFQQWDDVLSPLFSHSQARNYLRNFSIEEKNDILSQAENFLMQELLK